MAWADASTVRYEPEEIEFVDGPWDGKIVPFAEIGWTEWYEVRHQDKPDEVYYYVWHSDNNLESMLKGSKVKRVRMKLRKEPIHA